MQTPLFTIDHVVSVLSTFYATSMDSGMSDPPDQGERVIVRLKSEVDQDILDKRKASIELMLQAKKLIGQALPIMLESLALRDESEAILRRAHPAVAKLHARGSMLLFRVDDSGAVVTCRTVIPTDTCPSVME